MKKKHKIVWWRLAVVLTFPVWGPLALGLAMICLVCAPFFMISHDVYYWLIDEVPPMNYL
jgi:hypothetical protein